MSPTNEWKNRVKNLLNSRIIIYSITIVFEAILCVTITKQISRPETLFARVAIMLHQIHLRHDIEYRREIQNAASHRWKKYFTFFILTPVISNICGALSLPFIHRLLAPFCNLFFPRASFHPIGHELPRLTPPSLFVDKRLLTSSLEAVALTTCCHFRDVSCTLWCSVRVALYQYRFVLIVSRASFVGYQLHWILKKGNVIYQWPWDFWHSFWNAHWENGYTSLLPLDICVIRYPGLQTSDHLERFVIIWY